MSSKTSASKLGRVLNDVFSSSSRVFHKLAQASLYSYFFRYPPHVSASLFLLLSLSVISSQYLHSTTSNLKDARYAGCEYQSSHVMLLSLLNNIIVSFCVRLQKTPLLRYPLQQSPLFLSPLLQSPLLRYPLLQPPLLRLPLLQSPLLKLPML